MSGITTFIAAGDSFITRNIPENGYDGFKELCKIIQQNDVRFVNLETTIQNSEGFPAAFSGGTWAMSETKLLDDLMKFGFNLYNTANNHSGDYSQSGLLATNRNLRERGIKFAGTGSNLYEASSPTYLDCRNSRVALISACSTFHDSDIAGNQSPCLIGRPGLNPLRYKKIYHINSQNMEVLKRFAEKTFMNESLKLSVKNGFAKPIDPCEFIFAGTSFKLDDNEYLESIPERKDMERIKKSIEEAKRQADYVLVSIHSHEFAGTEIINPAEFLRTFAKGCIDSGADAILGHGPHELRGIEIYQNKPIFYSLGNFIFQTDTVNLQPADAYEKAELPTDSNVGELMDKRSHNGTSGYVIQPNIWNSVIAGFTAKNGKIYEIKLYPIELHMGEKRSLIGWPSLGSKKTIEYIARLSKPFGTEITVSDNYGFIEF